MNSIKRETDDEVNSIKRETNDELKLNKIEEYHENNDEHNINKVKIEVLYKETNWKKC